MRKIVPGLQVLASNVSTATVVVSPDPQILLFSYKNSDPRSPGPSASLVKNAETTEKMEGHSEPATEGDVQLKYYCDKLCSPNIRAFTEKCV
jgi:hypothetical protein